jgi:hypothetical protein
VLDDLASDHDIEWPPNGAQQVRTRGVGQHHLEPFVAQGANVGLDDVDADTTTSDCRYATMEGRQGQPVGNLVHAAEVEHGLVPTELNDGFDSVGH